MQTSPRRSFPEGAPSPQRGDYLPWPVRGQEMDWFVFYLSAALLHPHASARRGLGWASPTRPHRPRWGVGRCRGAYPLQFADAPAPVPSCRSLRAGSVPWALAPTVHKCRGRPPYVSEREPTIKKFAALSSRFARVTLRIRLAPDRKRRRSRSGALPPQSGISAESRCLSGYPQHVARCPNRPPIRA